MKKDQERIELLEIRLSCAEIILRHTSKLLSDLKKAWGQDYPGTQQVWIVDNLLEKYIKDYLK